MNRKRPGRVDSCQTLSLAAYQLGQSVVTAAPDGRETPSDGEEAPTESPDSQCVRLE